jgi:small-conductance mechanosensitive channel
MLGVSLSVNSVAIAGNPSPETASCPAEADTRPVLFIFLAARSVGVVIVICWDEFIPVRSENRHSHAMSNAFNERNDVLSGDLALCRNAPQVIVARMTNRLLTRVSAALLLFILTVPGFAQDNGAATEPAPPDLRALETGWWRYFEGTPAEVEPRIKSFLDTLATQSAELAPTNQVIAGAVLEAVRDNLTAYLELLDETELTLQELPPAAATYSLADLVRLAGSARDAAAGAAAEQSEVERERRILDGATRRRDAAFKDYVDAAAGDERWLAAIRLLRARSAQAISSRRLELLTQSYQRAQAYAAATAERVDLARDNLTVTAEEADLEGLEKQIESNAASVAKAQESLRTAEVAAIGLNLDTAEGRSQQRLQQQTVLRAEVGLALAQARLAQSQAERWWTELQLNTDPDMTALEADSLAWSELLRDATDRDARWKRDTEDELLAVQSTDRDGLNRASRRLLDQRLGTAQETLALIGELDSAIADLTLLSGVVDNALARYSGRIRSWWTSVSRDSKAIWLRLTDLTDFTLFSVGETPVTGGDILRVLIILALAILLSRGVRHAIKRVSESDYSGTQASLYTVGRLTHYAIIILAGFIALSSIGLDFSNLALVAGALSVGIGFGLQSIVSNFVSGLIILFEHTLRVGDYIELDQGLTGTVKAINVRSTLINTNDNIDIVVPNSEFVSSRLTNWTLGERILRVRVPFGVAYGSDKELVKKAALEAAAQVPYTLTNMKGRDPDVWLVEFGDSSLNFLLLVWVNRQGAKRPTRTRAAYLWALEDKFQEYGIEIPFPQRDLNLRRGWSSVRDDLAPTVD